MFCHHGYVFVLYTIVFSGNCRICRDLAFGSVKTRFKAILKKLAFSAQIAFLQLFGEIYDIGTKILFVQCFVTTDMFLFCKPIFFSGNCRICRDLAFGSVKTRFKAILKNWIFRPRSTFSWTFAPGGRLRYEAYNVFTFLIYIYITFTFTLHLHLHFKPCFFVIWPVVIHILDFFIVALPFDFFFWHLPWGVDVLFLYHCPKQTSF